MVSKVTEPSSEDCTTNAQASANQQMLLTPIEGNNNNCSSGSTDQLSK